MSRRDAIGSLMTEKRMPSTNLWHFLRDKMTKLHNTQPGRESSPLAAPTARRMSRQWPLGGRRMGGGWAAMNLG
jgi:hypothetical protein